MRVIKRSISIILILALFLTMAVSTAAQSAALNSDDYRSWSHKDSRWSSTVMGSSTVGNGGAPTTAITKLAIQAGLRDSSEFDVGSMAALLTNNSGYSGSAIIWSAPTNASLNLFSSYSVKQNTGTYTSSSNYSKLIGYIKDGWHLVIQVTTSSGGSNYVAVDEKLTLASGSTVYIMDCLSNTSNNTDIALAKRYSSYVRVIGYKGEASQNSSIDSDFRKWELNNTNWADTVLNGTSTINNSVVGGGDLVLASTKLAIQAGLWSSDTINNENSVNRAKAAIANYASGGVVDDWNDIKTAFGFNSVNSALIGSSSDRTAKINTSDTSRISNIIGYLNEGYYLAIRINSSVGWVAVDTEKTLAAGEIYIMRSTPDANRNADIKLADYYDTMNRVAGFKAEGVQVTFGGNASFTASYTKGGSTTSFSSGSYVPDEAVVTITATPNNGFTATDDWTISGGYTFSSVTTNSCTFTANKTVSAIADITYTPTSKNYNISYSYGANSSSFVYTTTPSSAPTGAKVDMEISAKTDGSFVYDLVIKAIDSDNNEISVTHNGNLYSFEMPSSDVTVSFSGQNIEDWRRWARDDERWRDKEIASSGGNSYTVLTDGAVMLSLAKMVIQAGLETPTTLTSNGYDVNDVVDALNEAGKIGSTGALTFDNTTATALGFASYSKLTSVSDNSVDVYATAANRKALVDNIKSGYHQIIRLYDGNGKSEWFIIDEEKTLAAAGDKTSVDLSDIYIYRATSDAENNANYNLQQLYDAAGFRYIRRNYAFLGGTTPSRKLSYEIKLDGANTEDTHKGAVTAEYILEGVASSFVSGAYVPSRSTVKLKYSAEQGYYSFGNWTTSDTAVTSLSASNSSKTLEFTVSESDFRTSAVTADISCNIAPEEYNIYYTDGEHFSYSNNNGTAAYNSIVSFTINPDSGFTVEADSVVFKDADDLVIAGLSASKNDRTYSFTMPAQDVYISAATSAQSADDYRTWGVNDSRWGTKIYSGSNSANTMGANKVGGADLILAFSKLMIQAGYTPSGVTAYNSLDASTGESNVKNTIDKLNVSTYPYSGGVIIDPTSNSNTSGWGLIANRLGIVEGYSTSNTNYCSVGATAGGSRSQAYMYPKLLASAKNKGNDANFSLTKTVNGTENAYTKLLLDYLDGTSTRVTTSTFANSTYDYIVNSNNYKFHLMIYVNSTYGWVAVDEAQSLNTGEIWVWASHNIVSNNGTGAGNIVKLSTLSTTFERVAGFKFADNSVYYGSTKVTFASYLGDSVTNKAGLVATYSYNGKTYGPYGTGVYVPYGAAVTVTRTALSDHYMPTVDKTYGAWTSSDYSSHSDTSYIFNTSAQGAAASRKSYDVKYHITAIVQVHVKFLGDANGAVNGARDTLSDATDIYQGDSVDLTISPDDNYEIDTLKIIKTDSSYYPLTPSVEEGLDPYETSITFGSELTGGEESWFIVEAAFKGNGIRITYNYKEYNPALSGTHEYIEPEQGDSNAFLTDSSYVITLNTYDASSENAVKSLVIANAPILQNVYFNYDLDLNSFSYNTSGSIHTANITLVPNVKNYNVSVNGTRIDGSFHYQEQIALDASDYNIYSDDVVWARGAENGKVGLANVCYDSIYSFRVIGDLNLTVGENLTSRSSVDGSSAITPGYTEVKRVNNVEKCIQNFYIQDFFDRDNPKIYDTNGDVIRDASDITLLGAGALFYTYDTEANVPVNSAFGGAEPTRESIYTILNNNKNSFLSEATAQGKSFKNSNIYYSYHKASTDNGNILRYSRATGSYNYFLSVSITNDRAAENQKYVYRAYSFYVCSYTLDGNTYVMPVLSDNYAQAKLYEGANVEEPLLSGENGSIEANSLTDNNDSMDSIFGN